MESHARQGVDMKSLLFIGLLSLAELSFAKGLKGVDFADTTKVQKENLNPFSFNPDSKYIQKNILRINQIRHSITKGIAILKSQKYFSISRFVNTKITAKTTKLAIHAINDLAKYCTFMIRFSSIS